MGESIPPRSAWTVVDEGWGRRAADLATLAEPSSCREYVVVHHKLGVDEGDRLLDVACGSGLALELAHLRGAVCAGIDASQRLVAVAALSGLTMEEVRVILVILGISSCLLVDEAEAGSFSPRLTALH